jgi:Hep_Hag.
MKKPSILISMTSIFFGALFLNAQSTPTTINLEGNLYIKDDLLTGTGNDPVKEGNLRINGSLVISDGTEVQAVASGKNSIAAGKWVRAFGDGSIAIGTTSNEFYATRAYGLHGIAIGGYARSGDGTTQSDYALSYGHHTNAIGNYSIAVGYYTEAKTILSVAVGYYAIASGHISTAIGYKAKAPGYMGLAFGRETSATGESAVAMGHNNSALGRGSMALGYYSSAEAVHSATLGYKVMTTSYGQTVVGVWNDPTAHPNNQGTYRAQDALFVVGNGTAEDNRSNALVMLKNGNTTVNGDLTANNMKVKNASGGIPMGAFGRSSE